MAEIIRLEERRGRRPVPSRASVPREAEILFFTGVRYERFDNASLDDSAAQKRPQAKKGRPRRSAKR